MKYFAATIAIVLLVAAAVSFVSYRLGIDPTLHSAVARGDAMEWLRADFHLTDEQFAQVKKLHEDYLPSCEEHCRLIREANEALKQSANQEPAARAAAEKRLQELRTHCETAITRHVRQVAACMSPHDGQRYLALVLPKLADFDHTAAPDLGLNHRH